MVKDVRTAFLQADAFAEDVIKYVCFFDPLLQRWEYFRQIGPLYGECSAPVRWEDTFATFLMEEGFKRGCNEPSAFYNNDHDTFLLTVVDDGLCDAEEADCMWLTNLLETRFQCRDTEWVVPDEPALDYLGMLLRQDSSRMYLSMETYILDTLELLDWSNVKPVCTPIAEQIDTESDPLSPSDTRLFMTGTGCLGWLANTVCPDDAFAHSRISQHMASPNERALSTLRRTFAYLKGTVHLSLSAPTYGSDKDVTARSIFTHPLDNETAGWEFYVDSDFAGNSESQNKRRSQNDYIALLNGAPALWGSKVSSVAFAHPQIGEAHADVSSGAAEVYAAANATYEFLNLSYIAEEINLEFPLPCILQMDNATAQTFAEGSAFKTKLKHIDCRQEWVKTLRDREICIPLHVDSSDNQPDVFEHLRDWIMFDPRN